MPSQDSAHKREITDARMLRIYCATQAKRATEQRFRLKAASVYPVICMDTSTTTGSAESQQIYTTFYYK